MVLDLVQQTWYVLHTLLVRTLDNLLGLNSCFILTIIRTMLGRYVVCMRGTKMVLWNGGGTFKISRTRTSFEMDPELAPTCISIENVTVALQFFIRHLSCFYGPHILISRFPYTILCKKASVQRTFQYRIHNSNCININVDGWRQFCGQFKLFRILGDPLYNIQSHYTLSSLLFHIHNIRRIVSILLVVAIYEFQIASTLGDIIL